MDTPSSRIDFRSGSSSHLGASPDGLVGSNPQSNLVPRTMLSINVNKVALIRNSRGENQPDVEAFSLKCLQLGADGITVHPRPDGRHIRYEDVHVLKRLVEGHPGKELNVEGYPSESFLELVSDVKPHQVTLVPDPPDALTSSFGWHVRDHYDMLASVTDRLHQCGIRVSVFMDPNPDGLVGLSEIGVDRVELYTYLYAKQFREYFAQYSTGSSRVDSVMYLQQRVQGDLRPIIQPYVQTAAELTAMGIAINAGHDLNAGNLAYFLSQIPACREVSIGHAFVCDCLYDGLESTMMRYCACL